jgi:hypothetical protein
MLQITGKLKNPNIPEIEMTNPFVKICPHLLPLGKIEVDVEVCLRSEQQIGEENIYIYSPVWMFSLPIEKSQLRYLKNEIDIYTATIKAVEEVLIQWLQNKNSNIQITQI